MLFSFFNFVFFLFYFALKQVESIEDTLRVGSNAGVWMCVCVFLSSFIWYRKWMGVKRFGFCTSTYCGFFFVFYCCFFSSAQLWILFGRWTFKQFPTVNEVLAAIHQARRGMKQPRRMNGKKNWKKIKIRSRR